MTSPSAETLYNVCEATWPPAKTLRTNGFVFRDGAGGGKRVSATTVDHVPNDTEIVDAEARMRALEQPALFMVREGENALDAKLNDAGYVVIDPVQLYAAPVELLTSQAIPPVTAFSIWEPLAIMTEIWAEGGIGPARLKVMERANQKTAVFCRWKDKPAGVAFAGLHGNVCMVHAVEVLAHQRRQGVAQWIMRQAAFWAQANGAAWMSVLCVHDNLAANTLYKGLGFQPSGAYHYRIKEAS
ncbi:MAG: GNAT family N-acetyltransferase [Paracoccaceae bacterium]